MVTTVRRAEFDDLPSVFAIHKRQKKWLGHLPHEPFEEAIREGRLLVACSPEDVVVGYVLYRLRKTLGDAAIVHLAVDPDHAGAGVGGALLEALSERLADLRRIVLSCRQDYPAHEFWLRAGFEAIDERPGRSVDGKPLTHFERRLRRDLTLFDGLYEASEPFAVDLDVLLDLATDRSQGELTREVFQQLDQFAAHPLRTISLSNELVYHSDRETKEAARRVMSTWEAARAQGSEDRLRELCGLVSSAEETDLRHVCDAEANHVSVLLTRDTDFIRAMSSDGVGVSPVRVMAPATFVDTLMHPGDQSYLPAHVRGLECITASDLSVEVLVDGFVSGQGERKAHIRGVLHQMLASPDTELRCLIRDGAPVCLYSLRVSSEDAAVDLLRGARGDDFSTVMRQALGAIRAQASEDGGYRVLTIRETYRPPALERALLKEGFEQRDDAWCSTPASGAFRCSVLGDELRQFTGDERWDRPVALAATATTSPQAAAELEAAMDPMVLADSAMEAVLVPIRAGWSDRLVGVTSAQLALDVSGGSVGGLREHVYFRSPHGLKLTAPFRVFWYRTSDDPSRVFATSVVDKALIRSEPEIWGRFGGYGVLERAEVAERIDEDGHVMALRFVRTRRLLETVTLGQLQAVASSRGLRVPAVPVGPLRLDPELQTWLLEEVGVE